MRPREWVGTVSRWSLYQEPYKNLWGYPRKFEESLKEQGRAPAATVVGLPGSPGVVEDLAIQGDLARPIDEPHAPSAQLGF